MVIQKRDFLPLFKGYKRMFAGSELHFFKKVNFNTIAEKTSKIIKIEKKSSAENTFFFVTFKIIIISKKKKILIEYQNIVFINKNYKSKKQIFVESASIK